MIQLIDVVAHVQHHAMSFACIQVCGDTERVFLYATETAPDNFNPTQTFTVQRGRMVAAEYRTEHEAAEVVRELGHYLADHEFDEQFTFNGAPVFNPHSVWDATPNP